MFSSLLADGKEKEKKRLCFAKNLSYSLSLPWLKWVLLSHAWPKIRRRRKGALSLSLSLSLSLYIYIYIYIFRSKQKNKIRNNQGQPFTGKRERRRWQDIGKRPAFNVRNLGSNWRPTRCCTWESAERRGSCRSPLFTTATKISNSHMWLSKNCTHVTQETKCWGTNFWALISLTDSQKYPHKPMNYFEPT